MKDYGGVNFLLPTLNLDRNYEDCLASYHGSFNPAKIVLLSIRLGARWATELILISILHGERNIFLCGESNPGSSVLQHLV